MKNSKFSFMKKLTRLIIVAAGILFILALSINPVSAQATKMDVVGGKLIPEGVTKVTDNSCMKCHAEPGNSMALSHLNLTKWDTYSPEKQASKAKAMCNIVTKGKMPPKNFKKEHPDAVPTKDQIATICDWSQSLQVPKK
jgi:hypothetical protein